MAKPKLKTYFGRLTDKNIEQLRKLNLVTFPVRYNDKFYSDVLRPENADITKLVYHSDILVGAVCCRREVDDKIYIMTLGVLEPYRRYGVGSMMIEHIVDVVKELNNTDYIYLHVQISNREAIDFYLKHDFVIAETIENYYKKIKPSQSHLLKLQIRQHETKDQE